MPVKVGFCADAQARHDARPVPSGVVQPCVCTQSLCLTWQLLSLSDEDAASVTGEPAALSKAVDRFAAQLAVIGDECGDDSALADTAIRAQGDLFTIFDAAKLQACPPLLDCCRDSMLILSACCSLSHQACMTELR